MVSVNYSYLNLAISINLLGPGKECLERLVIEDAPQRERIISSVYDSNHLGINRTMDMIMVKYYWPGMSNDIRLYVSSKSQPACSYVAIFYCRFHHVTSAKEIIIN